MDNQQQTPAREAESTFRRIEKLDRQTDFKHAAKVVGDSLKKYEHRLVILGKRGQAARTTDIELMANVTLMFTQTLLQRHKRFEFFPRRERMYLKSTSAFIYGELFFFRALIDPKVRGRDMPRIMAQAARDAAEGAGANREYNKLLRQSYDSVKTARTAVGRSYEGSFRQYNNNRSNSSNSNRFGSRQQQPQSQRRRNFNNNNNAGNDSKHQNE
jgi:hypothetical protein